MILQSYASTLKAIDPIDGELKTWAGPPINAFTLNEAKKYCQENGLGYLFLDGSRHIVSEVIYPDMVNSNHQNPVTE